MKAKSGATNIQFHSQDSLLGVGGSGRHRTVGLDKVPYGVMVGLRFCATEWQSSLGSGRTGGDQEGPSEKEANTLAPRWTGLSLFPLLS